MPRILGIDHGTRRIGLALSDEDGTMSLPLGVIEVGNPAATITKIVELCGEKKVDLIVLGLPLNMDGTSGPAARSVQEFAVLLRDKTGLRVETWDERLTTAQVEKVLLQGDARRSKRREVRDQLAAQVILQGYLDCRSDADLGSS